METTGKTTATSLIVPVAVPFVIVALLVIMTVKFSVPSTSESVRVGIWNETTGSSMPKAGWRIIVSLKAVKSWPSTAVPLTVDTCTSKGDDGVSESISLNTEAPPSSTGSASESDKVGFATRMVKATSSTSPSSANPNGEDKLAELTRKRAKVVPGTASTGTLNPSPRFPSTRVRFSKILSPGSVQSPSPLKSIQALTTPSPPVLLTITFCD